MSLQKFFKISFLILFSFCQSLEKNEKLKYYYSDEKTEKELWNEIFLNTEKKDFSKAFTLIQKLQHNQNPEYLKILGNYYEKTQDYPKALEFYKLAYNVQKQVELGLSISRILTMLGETKKAVLFLEEMQQEFRKNFNISIQLGILYKQVQVSKAETIFRELLEESQDKNEIEILHLHYLDSLLLQKKYEKAEKYFQTIKTKPFSKNLLYLWELHFELDKARESLRKNDFKTAIQSLSIAYTLDPENEELGYELSSLLCKTKEFSKAEKIITEMKDLEWKFLSLGVYFFYRNDLEQSLQYLEQGYANYSHNPEYLKQLGNFFFYIGNLQKAKFYFHEGKAKNPKDPSFSFQLGLIAIEENLLELAEKEFENSKELGNSEAELFILTLEVIKTSNEKEIFNLEKNLNSLTSNQWKISILQLLGNFFFQKRDFKKAKTYYNLILKETPNSYYTLIRMYEIAQLEKNHKQIQQYEKEIFNLPNLTPEKKKLFLEVKNRFTQNINEKIKISKLVLRFANANEILQTYLNEPNAKVLTEIIFYLEEIGEKEKALEILKILSNRNPNFKELFGFYLWKLGEKNRASEIFAALQRSENNFFIEYNLGIIHLNTNPKKALEHFFTSLSMNSEYYFTYLGITKAYFYLNEYEKAKQYLELVREKFGETELILWNLGFLELQLGETENAQKIFSKMKKKFNSAHSLYGLALVYEKKGKENIAKKYLHEAIKKEENPEYLEKLIQLLNKENSEELDTYTNYFIRKFPHTSFTRELLLKRRGHILYESKLNFPLEEIDYFQIVGDNLYFIKKKKLYCLDRINSLLKWSYEFKEEIEKVHIFFSGILVYTSSHTIFFLDLLNGNLLWKRHLIISEMEKIEGYYHIFLVVHLENQIRKLYQLDQNGNIQEDLPLEENENLIIDGTENIYLLKIHSTISELHRLNLKWEKEKLKEWKHDKIQVLVVGKRGLYVRSENKIELIANNKFENLGKYISNGEYFEYKEKLYSYVQEKFFEFNQNWEEIRDPHIILKLQAIACRKQDCLKKFLLNKNLKNLSATEKLIFLEFNLD